MYNESKRPKNDYYLLAKLDLSDLIFSRRILHNIIKRRNERISISSMINLNDWNALRSLPEQ